MLDTELFSSGFNKAINSGVNSTLAHKVADAVVKHHSSCGVRCAPEGP